MRELLAALGQAAVHHGNQLTYLLPLAVPAAAMWGIFYDHPVSGSERLVLTGFAIAQAGALCWIRRSPAGAVAAVSAIHLAATVVLDQHLLFGVLVSAYAAASRGGGRERSVAGWLALIVILAKCLIPLEVSRTHLLDSFFLLGTFGGFWLSGWYEASRRDYMAALHERSELLEREREVVQRRAADAERAKLVRDLHDILNHSITAMVLDAEAGEQTGDERAARATLRRVATTGRDSLGELRRLLGILRAAPDGTSREATTPRPDLSLLDQLVATIPEGGPRVRLEREGSARPVDASIEVAAYRVVQESLTNVIKHAGAVDVLIRLTHRLDRLDILVHNAPSTVPTKWPATRGTGLVGMRERVTLLGGSLQVGPSDDGGFALAVTLPLAMRP